MEWDLGLQGVAVLLVMSLAFGVFTEVVFWGYARRWLWLAAAALMFVIGLFVSEGLFGWATEEDVQPNIDGLSFDEVLVTFLVGIVVVLVAERCLTSTSRVRSHRPGRESGTCRCRSVEDATGRVSDALGGPVAPVAAT